MIAALPVLSGSKPKGQQAGQGEEYQSTGGAVNTFTLWEGRLSETMIDKNELIRI